MLLFQSRRSSNDVSKILSQYRIWNENSNSFVLILNLWCQKIDIFKNQYSNLKKILRMLKFHQKFNRLSTNYDSLRRRIKEWLSQFQLRRILIFLNVSKMSSLTERKKQYTTNEKMKKYFYFFDFVDLFQKTLTSSITKKMHFDFDEFRTHSVEFWHFSIWISSIKTISENFVRYRNDDSLFLFDWISYSCDSDSDNDNIHLSRMIEIDFDYRDDIANTKRKKFKLKTQLTYWNHEILIHLFDSQFFSSHEIMLLKNFIFFDESAIFDRQANIEMKYNNAFLSQSNITFNVFICRSLLNKKKWLQFFAYFALSKVELKLNIYDRNYFANHFNTANDNKCFFLSYFLFFDDFDLYRNFYRSLMNVYLQFASFSFHEKMRRSNVFFLTLNSHDSNFNDVFDAMSSLRNFDKDIVLDLSQSTKICAFSICMIENMSQQQVNAACKSQRAIFECRFCLISSEDRENLKYDIIQNERFHNQMMQQRRKMNQIRAVAKRETFVIKWNLSTEESALMKLFFALDITLIKFSDSAHFEYAEVCKQLHHLLLNAILSLNAIQLYAVAIRIWFFASEFTRIQFSVHHLKNYNLFEHVRWIVIMSGLLRCWLQKKYLQSNFFNVIRTHFTFFRSNIFIAVEIIVSTFASIARSISLLMTDELTNREQLMNIVKNDRYQFQQFLKFAAAVANSNFRFRSITSKRRKSMISAQSVENESELKILSISMFQKTQEYVNDQRRSNVHIAIHYETTMKEYEMSSNVNVLINENKHRWINIIFFVSFLNEFYRNN